MASAADVLKSLRDALAVVQMVREILGRQPADHKDAVWLSSDDVKALAVPKSLLRSALKARRGERGLPLADFDKLAHAAIATEVKALAKLIGRQNLRTGLIRYVKAGSFFSDPMSLAYGLPQLTYFLEEADRALQAMISEQGPAKREQAPEIPDPPEGRQWTDLEIRILQALHYNNFTLPGLVNTLGKKSSTIRDALLPRSPLRTSGYVNNQRRLGYYRTDARPGQEPE